VLGDIGQTSADTLVDAEAPLHAEPDPHDTLVEPRPVTDLNLDGRPGWLVEGPRARYGDAERDERAHLDAPEDERAILEVDDRARASSRVTAAPSRGHSRRPPTAAQVGSVIGREVARTEMPTVLRLLLRISVVASLLMLAAAVRRCSAVDEVVHKALARFGHHRSSSEPAVGFASPQQAGSYGPAAEAWLESDLHQFTNGDKERVSDLVHRFESAGALEVHVGHITRSGMLDIAGELIVELPDDADKRKALLAEYQRFLQGTFGDLVARPHDPEGPVLRVAL
jgi:hypothetical protein